MKIKEKYILDDDVFRELSEMVYQWTGIYLTEKKKYFLISRLQRRLEETQLPDFRAYLNYLKYYANGSERVKFIDAITTKETSFFREEEHFEVMMDIIKQRDLFNPSVLSVGCSTGEEPYSVAIVFKEEGIRGMVYGMDISESAIETARRGVYTDYSLRSVSEAVKRIYFAHDGDSYLLRNDIKAMVTFFRGNVLSWDDMSRFKGIDIVFCRNLLIYFDEDSRDRACANIYEILNRGGLLFLGISETGYRMERYFRPVKINNVIVYERL